MRVSGQVHRGRPTTRPWRASLSAGHREMKRPEYRSTESRCLSSVHRFGTGCILPDAQSPSAVVAAVSDLANDIALGDDPDRRLAIVDHHESVHMFVRHSPGRFVERL